MQLLSLFFDRPEILIILVDRFPRTVDMNEKEVTAPKPSPLEGIGAPERIRTSDLRIRSPTLYPSELRAPSFRSFLCSGENLFRNPPTTAIFMVLQMPVDPLFQRRIL